jgi:hypothetical protein
MVPLVTEPTGSPSERRGYPDLGKPRSVDRRPTKRRVTPAAF